KIGVVQLADYDLAASRADGELRKQADAQVEAWKKQAQPGQTVYGVLVKKTGITPAGDVVGTELPVGQTSFDLTATGTATGYSVATNEPRSTTVDRLHAAADIGFDIDREGAVVDIVGSPSVEDDGVHWRVRGLGSQFRRVDEAAIKSALAGRGLEEVSRVVSDRGLRFVRVSTWPGWWPRLPVLDSRIQIQSPSRAAAAP
ncbi:MAG: hypothetical protein Q7S41_00555, partial [Candidatus Limnocylindria bacterium]|nr:hypothetical protein [Candidatus Limnocylindria bacterium]